MLVDTANFLAILKEMAKKCAIRGTYGADAAGAGSGTQPQRVI